MLDGMVNDAVEARSLSLNPRFANISFLADLKDKEKDKDKGKDKACLSIPGLATHHFLADP